MISYNFGEVEDSSVENWQEIFYHSVNSCLVIFLAELLTSSQGDLLEQILALRSPRVHWNDYMQIYNYARHHWQNNSDKQYWNKTSSHIYM